MFGVSVREFTSHVQAAKESVDAQRKINDANNSLRNILGSSVEELRRRVDEMESRLRERDKGDDEGAAWSLDIEERMCRLEKFVEALAAALSRK